MHSYILTGLRMGPLMKLLRKKGFSASPRNVGRLVFLMHNAFWSSFFTWREKKKYGKRLDSWPVPDDPVIIVGHWRTGSTFLHLLMAKDTQFVAPSVFQTAFPDCFLSADKFYRPVMGRMINKRPMDNVRLGFDDPQEDEFALVKLTLDSPLLDIIFQEKEGYFINNYEDFNPSRENFLLWKEKLTGFYKKIRQDSGRMPLLKNPAHSLRIPFLREVFPNARFIHIHRHPYDVVASSLNLWKVLMRDNSIKGKCNYPNVDEVTSGLNKFYELISRDFEDISVRNKCQVAYEDLVSEPLESLKRVYDELGLNISDEFEQAIRSFIEQNKDFRKNSYTFEEEDKEKVYRGMKKIFEQFNYPL